MKINCYKLLAAVFTLLFSAGVQAQLITTIAGNGVGGSLVWGGPATTTQFNMPTGLCLDPSTGNLYIADSVNNLIHMVDPAGINWIVAGGGTAGLGDGLPAVGCMLNGPTGVAHDGSNLYIADCGNHRVRKVNSSGIITTIVNNAGTTTGPLGDGGPALLAMVDHPYGLRFDGVTSNLYIADRDNNSIRMVDPFGKIWTVAGFFATPGLTVDGGPATAAEFNDPSGVAVDLAGNIYIADRANNVIRKINTSGIISTFAGNTLAGYSGDGAAATLAKLTTPSGIAYDPSGTGALYIADAGNNVIRKVTFSTGFISTFAGAVPGTAGFNDGAAAAAKFTNPTGVSVNSAGTIVYVADKGNNRIRKITGGAVTTVAGTGAAGNFVSGALANASLLNSPSGVAQDATGNVYIANSGANNVAKITVLTGFITGIAGDIVAGSAGTTTYGISGTTTFLNNPTGVVVDATGNVYIADQANNHVDMVTPGGIINNYTGNGTAFYGGDGYPAITSQIAFAEGITLDNTGNLLIADTKNERIRIVYNAAPPSGRVIGDIYTIGGNGTSGYGGLATYLELKNPTGVTTAATGDMYIADRANNVVRKVDGKGVMSTFAGTGVWGYTGDGAAAALATFSAPVSVAYYNAGPTLYVGDALNNVVRAVDIASGKISTYAGTGAVGYTGDGGLANAAKLHQISGLEVDQFTGDLYITDQLNSVVRKVNAITKIITTIAGTGVAGFLASGGPATATMLYQPYSVTTDKTGNVFLADRDNHVVRKIDPTGNISIFAGTGFQGFTADGSVATKTMLDNPNGVALDAAGNLYISDMGNNRIRKVTKATNIVTTVAGNGSVGPGGDGGSALGAQLYYPQGIACDLFGNLYIADGNNNKVRVVNLTTGIINAFAGTGTAGYTGDGGAALSATLSDPKGVYIDGGQNVFIADFLNNVVRRVDKVSGNIATIAGTGVNGFSGDGGPATSAKLSQPAAVIMDTTHSILIADFTNQRIRRIDIAGKISTVAGNGTFGYSGDGGAAIKATMRNPIGLSTDDAGSFYIADRDNNVIRKVTTVLLASFDTSFYSSLPICQDSCIHFSNTSIGSTDSIKWSVTPAGPFISNVYVDTPTICFNSGAGTFVVTLTIYSGIKTNAFSYNVTVNPTPHPVIVQSGSQLFCSGAYSTLQWNLAGTPITGAVTNPFTWFPTPGVGTYTITVDSNGCLGTSASIVISTNGIMPVNIVDNNKYWLSQQGQDNSIVNLYAQHPVNDALAVTMYDPTGREIMSDKWSKGSSTIQIKAASLAPGMYIIKLTNNTTSEVLKWLKN